MPDRSRLRLVVLGVLVLSLVATLLGRLWYLQVLNAPQLRAEALNQQIHDIVTPAPRGEILDDTGKPFVDNKPALVVSVDRTALDRLGTAVESTVLHRLAVELGTSYTLLSNETKPCSYKKVQTSHGLEVTSSPTPCNNGVAYQPVVVSQLKPTLAAARKALQIKEKPEDYPGVTVELTGIRHYPKPDGALASSMLGYIQPISLGQLDKLPTADRAIYQNADVGATGLESEYEQDLRGVPGVKQVSVDHLGAVTGTVKDTPPVPGDDVVTNLDAGVQAALEHELQAAINAARSSHLTADFAAGVVLNVRTGGIVAMSSLPTYQPNQAPPTLTTKRYNQLLHAPGSPLFDKAFQGASAPGSTFKLISSSGLLWDGTASRYGTYDCSGSYLGKTNFEGEVGGFESLHQAIVQSCDTVFYRLAVADWNRDNRLVKEHKPPVEGVQRIAHAYGIGVKNPGVDLPGAATGHIADRKNQRLNWLALKKDYCAGAARRTRGSPLQRLDAFNCKDGYLFQPGDQMNEDIGQGTVTLSPLQLAVAYAALANGGTVFEPRVAKAIVSPTGKLIKRIKAPVRDHLPVSKIDLDYIRNAMYGVTHEQGGTGYGVFAGFPMGRVDVGGKTGTAELTGTSQNGSWFASFAGPAGQAPQFVTVIEVDKSDQGAVSAAPFVRNMWEQIYGIGGNKALFPNGVPPTKLPKVRIVEAGPPRHHHAHATVSSSSTSRATTSTSTSTTPASQAADGPPPALEARTERRGSAQ
ncbi:MAG TPA: penicillin-binding transpeptidase domain-containing protein [Mycobacteriales bacterium]|nr:penicillin-binding transpeptidase domain-containing protein [Mycobacteriales bacterium]